MILRNSRQNFETEIVSRKSQDVIGWLSRLRLKFRSKPNLNHLVLNNRNQRNKKNKIFNVKTFKTSRTDF